MKREELEFVRLASIPTLSEAGMVLQLLVNNDIRALLKGANFGALEPLSIRGGFSEIQLLVAKDDLDRARELFHAFFTRGDSITADEDPTEDSHD